MITVEINGKKIETQPGKTIIEVADEHRLEIDNIPRFCYHKKLSVAANCRMCLVEVEQSRKPLPACATPVTNGMKVFTHSPLALAAQKAVMEFLLINHPLDCPICDQGGECELQDISLGYGSDSSAYSETKRSVVDENLGSLIATEMTRCIHCTRCVRFGDEIAGMRELGAIGRGERMAIATFVEHSLSSEVSGNIIDLCPVGALTSKPYRFTARPWELKQYETISPHDNLGSNLYAHVRANRIMRMVPRENEMINETWLADRDRFSYLGLYSSDRVTSPLMCRDGKWEKVDWETALTTIAAKIPKLIKEHGADQLAMLASPNATIEELYLFQKLGRSLGCHNLDHRLHQTDFADQESASLMPIFPIPYQEIEAQNYILLLGSDIHREQPLAGLRVRKAVLHGAEVAVINSLDNEYHFPVSEKLLSSHQQLPIILAEVLKAVVGEQSEGDWGHLLQNVKPSDAARRIAASLKQMPKKLILLGELANNHPQAAIIRTLAHYLAQVTGSNCGVMTTGANSAGAWLAGMIPHRGALGENIKQSGLNWQESLSRQLKAYLLLGIEPEFDCADPALAQRALRQAELVVVMTPYETPAMLAYADIILPTVPFTETSGSFMNLEGRWQTFQAVHQALGEARPAWKVLRVLGNLLNLDGFDYNTSLEVCEEIQTLQGRAENIVSKPYCPPKLPVSSEKLFRIGRLSLYCSDNIVRRAQALHQSASHERLAVRVNTMVANKFNLQNAKTVTIKQAEEAVTLPLIIDESIIGYHVYLPTGYPETINLGPSCGEIEIKQAS